MNSRLEPNIIDNRSPHIKTDNPNGELALISIAISMKRIADALDNPHLVEALTYLATPSLHP